MKKRLLIAFATVTVVTAKAQLPNTGMEQWRNVNVQNQNFEVPVDWNSADSFVTTLSVIVQNPQKHVFKSQDAHGGSFAALVMSRDLPNLGVLTGVLSNAQVGYDLSKFDPTNPSKGVTFSGGTAVSQRVGGVKAMVKYTTKTTDTAGMIVRAVMNNSIIGEGYATITATGNYIQIFAPIVYNNSTSTPTEIIVAFASSAGATARDSSSLYIDDVDFVSVGVNDLSAEDKLATIYPNPVMDVLHINASGNSTLRFEAYNLTGQKVLEAPLVHKSSLNISMLPAGLYTFRITDRQKQSQQKGKFSVIR